jgi:Family of unknown function (DUF6326)
MNDVRVRVSTLWIFVMFNMLAADVISFLDGALLEQLLSGHAGQVQITGTFQLVAAVLLEIPIAMIVLSRTLPDRSNRVGNIAAAALTAVFVVGGGSVTPHYVFFAAVELGALALIGWSAWRWLHLAAADRRVGSAVA